MYYKIASYRHGGGGIIHYIMIILITRTNSSNITFYIYTTYKYWDITWDGVWALLLIYYITTLRMRLQWWCQSFDVKDGAAVSYPTPAAFFGASSSSCQTYILYIFITINTTFKLIKTPYYIVVIKVVLTRSWTR